MFYALFHAYLNLLAEVTRFGDRLFYLQWWSCGSFKQFWRTWNLPVLFWIKRHLQLPMITAGYKAPSIMAVVFLFSAVLHELLASVPLHICAWYSLAAMLSQAPMCAITEHKYIKNNPRVGNLMFWTSFCFIGQPLAAVLYYTHVKGGGAAVPSVSWVGVLEGVASLNESLTSWTTVPLPGTNLSISV